MTLPVARKDASASKAWLRALEMTARIEDAPRRTFPAVIEELGARFGDAPALIGLPQQYSHAQLAARANQFARWGLAQNIRKGDTVCLLMPNACDYLAIWLGLTRIGAVVALLNTNLKGEALAHSIAVAAPTHIIAAEFWSHNLTTTAQLWHYGEAFRRLLEDFSGAALAENFSRRITAPPPSSTAPEATTPPTL